MIRFRGRFPALAVRGYRSFYLSQSVSLVGTWMQNLALPWLAYTLTGSPLLLGLVGAVLFLPNMLLSVFAGALTDRLVKVNAVLATQITMSLASAMLAALVFLNAASYPILLAVALLLGLAGTLDFPARQAMVGELVGRDLVMNAVALNSSLFNLARILGPALAGLLMGAWGIGWCFALNALSFLPAIAVLARLPRTPVERAEQGPSLFQSALEGVRYLRRQTGLRNVLAGVMAMSILGFNFSVLLPVLVKSRMGLGETAYGLLMSCMGVGSLAAALLIAARSHRGPRVAVFRWAPLVTGALFVALAFAPWYPLAAALMVVVGFSNVAYFTTANSYLQVNSQTEFRGRVLSFYLLLFGGMTPVGNLLAGTLVEWGGPTLGFLASGLALLVIFLAWRPRAEAFQPA